MRVLFSKDVIDYVIRNKLNPAKRRTYNKLSTSLQAFKTCDNCLHYHNDKYLFNTQIDECYYCDCKLFKPIPFRLEIYTLLDLFEFKYIHKTKSSLYWKLVELETKQSQVIKDYVHLHEPKCR